MVSSLSLDPSYAALTPRLQQAATQLGLALTDDQITQLLYYLQQLLFWNKAYNLTAIKDRETALVKHIIDSLAIVPHLPAGSLLDIGTGAGLPSVIVAICQPARSVTADRCRAPCAAFRPARRARAPPGASRHARAQTP